MAIIGELIAKIHADTTSFDKAINKSGQSLQTFNKNIEATGRKMKETGGKISMLASTPVLGVLITSLNKLKQSNDPANQSLKDLDKTIGGLQIEIAKAFLPIIEEAAKWIKGLADWFTNLDKGTKETIITVGLLVAAIGPLIAIIGTFMSMGIVGAFVGIAVAVAGVTVALANTRNEMDKTTASFKIGTSQWIDHFERVNEKGVKGLKLEDLKKRLEGVNIEIGAQKNALTELDTRQKQMNETYAKGGRELLQIGENSWRYATLQEQLERIALRRKESQTRLNEIMYQYYLITGQIDKVENPEKYEKINKDLEDKWNRLKDLTDLQQSALDKYKPVYMSIDEMHQKFVDGRKASLEVMTADVQGWADSIQGYAMPVLEALGTALKSGGDAWEALRKAALSAIASIVEALAQQLIILGSKEIAEGFAALAIPVVGGALAAPHFAAGAGFYAAAAAAYVGAGVIRALKDGGLVMPQQGGTIVRMAEAGVPEYAVPERKDYLSRLADRITDNMSRMKIENSFNPNISTPVTVKIGEREICRLITDASRDGRVLIHPRRGISKR